MLGFGKPSPKPSPITHAEYLQDSGVTLGGLRFWGSPWQPIFFDWAFNLPRGEALAQKWALIPDGTDVVVTHGPPLGYGDRCHDGRRVGCEELLPALERIGARLHICGHIHEDHGRRERGDLVLVNASICDLRYRPVQPPLVVDL